MSPHEHFDSLADDDLLRNIVQGCTDCFALLFHRYCRQVFSVSYRIIRDKAEAEDILQEVFLSIYQQQERYNPSRGSIRTWIWERIERVEEGDIVEVASVHAGFMHVAENMLGY